MSAQPDTAPEPVAEVNDGAQVVQFRPRNTLTAKLTYAKAMAESALLPPQYRGKPANMLWAMEYADMLGLAPMAAVTGIHVIEGRPTASSALISALVRRAGHRLRVSGNDTKAVAEIVRSDDQEFTFRAEWTIDRATRANLTGKSVWKQYPAAMLKARAITEVARDACEEALAGMHYTAEELGAEVDEEGVPTTHVEQVPQQSQPPQVDWDAEIVKCGRDRAKLGELWKRAPRDSDARDRIAAAAKGAAAAKPDTETEPAAAPEVVDAELVPDEPQPSQTLDALLAAADGDTVQALADAVQAYPKVACQNVSGFLVNGKTSNPAAVELGINKGERIDLGSFAALVLGYVEANGYSVNEGVRVAAAEDAERSASTERSHGDMPAAS